MPSKRAFQTVTVADAATSQMRDRLFAGEYESGEEIKDTQLAEELGIARPTARVVVQQLITEGMLVREPGASARVRTFDPEQVRDIFRVRTLIELDAVRAVRADQSDVSAVKKALQGFAELDDAPSWAEIAAVDTAFHLSVVEAGGSERLGSVFQAISNELRLLLALPEQHFGRGESAFEEHQELYDALSGDIALDELEGLWGNHLDESRDFLIAKLESALAK